MSEEKCANCGYDMCEGMAVYACEVCGKDCCSECTDNWGICSVICRECDDVREADPELWGAKAAANEAAQPPAASLNRRRA